MCIGSVARLLLLRKQSVGDTHHALEEDVARCFWSIYILERAFSSSAVQLTDVNAPMQPPSAILPPRVVSTGDGNHSPDFLADSTAVKDFGINFYFLDLMGIWGRLLNHLHELRDGKVEDSWTSESMYAKLQVQLFEADRRLCPKHLLRNACFSSRTKEQLCANQQYWHPWLSKQLLAHAIPAILNHPFIHLSAFRDGNGSAARSRFFLQQTVDTALLHSAWVARLLSMADEHDFKIWNPLIGDLVASTATVAWLFQFTGDMKTSATATENFKTFQVVLSRLAVSWPHLAIKVSTSSLTSQQLLSLSSLTAERPLGLSPFTVKHSLGLSPFTAQQSLRFLVSFY